MKRGTMSSRKARQGGIDGVTIQEFDKEKRKQIPMLIEEQKSGKWKPYPYLEIEVAKTKNPDEIPDIKKKESVKIAVI
jgi:retron-type reverse transcriptase